MRFTMGAVFDVKGKSVRKKESYRETAAPNVPRRLGLTILLVVLDLALALGAVKRNWFSSLGFGAYLWLVWDNVSLWAGRIVTVAAALTPLWIALSRQRRSARMSAANDSPSQPKESYIERGLPLLLVYLSKGRSFLWILVCLVAPIPALTFFLTVPIRPFPLPPSAVAVS